MIQLPREIFDEIIAHARTRAPQRASGAVAGFGESARRIYPFQKTSDFLTPGLDLDTSELFAASGDADLLGLSLLGIYYSDPHGGDKPPADLIANWYLAYTCFIVSLRASPGAILTAWRIDRGTAMQIDLDIPGIEGQPAASSESVLQAVRRKFTINRFVGWQSWLIEFNKALEQRDFPVVRALLNEVRVGGYELSPIEQDRLADWADFAYHREGGVLTLWQEHDSQLHASGQASSPADEARIRYRLGLAYQQFPQYEVARKYYNRSLELFQTAEQDREASRVRMALLALDQLENTGVEDPYFEGVIRLIRAGRVDVQDECRRLARDVMLSDDDWRRGREAVLALERWNELKTVAGGLTSASSAVHAAAIAALRRNGVARCELELVAALRHESDFVRWQAALALSGGSQAIVKPLLESLRREADQTVRLAMASSLHGTGDPVAMAGLNAFPDVVEALSSVIGDPNAGRDIFDAIRIHSTFRSSVPPSQHFGSHYSTPHTPPPPPRTYKDLLSDLDRWIRSAPLLWCIATVISAVMVGPVYGTIIWNWCVGWKWRATPWDLYTWSFVVIFTAAAKNGVYGECVFGILVFFVMATLLSRRALRRMARAFSPSSSR